MLIAAAVCSASAFVGLITWMRVDAVNGALVDQHERRLSTLEGSAAEERKSIIILQQDTKHILEGLDEIKAQIKGKL
jgi:TolA-binding protein